MTQPSADPAGQRPVQGQAWEAGSATPVAEAVEVAFDYRGDVTVQTADGRTLEGYIFDRCAGGGEPYLRLLVRDTAERVRLPYLTLRRIVLSGRDTAEGKSWETWLRKYQERKARGEAASLEPEPLE